MLSPLVYYCKPLNKEAGFIFVQKEVGKINTHLQILANSYLCAELLTNKYWYAILYQHIKQAYSRFKFVRKIN